MLLARATRRGEITVAVNPFDLQAPPFARPSGLFPQYTGWGVETWLLTAAWLGAGVVVLVQMWRSAQRDA